MPACFLCRRNESLEEDLGFPEGSMKQLKGWNLLDRHLFMWGMALQRYSCFLEVLNNFIDTKGNGK
jgi:hypothetical protein